MALSCQGRHSAGDEREEGILSAGGGALGQDEALQRRRLLQAKIFKSYFCRVTPAIDRCGIGGHDLSGNLHRFSRKEDGQANLLPNRQRLWTLESKSGEP